MAERVRERDQRPSPAPDEDAAERARAEQELEALLPAGLSRAWPVPRQAVLGTRDGALARLEALVASGALGGLARLPGVAREAVVDAVARLAKRVDARRDRAARTFLAQALGPLAPAEMEARVLEAWRHFFRVLLETEGFERRVPRGRVLERYDVHLCEQAERLRRERTGCVVVTAHVGNWEAAAALAPWLGFDPFYAVAKPPKNRPLAARVQRVREGRGIRLLPRRGALRSAGPILEAGGAIGLLLDQRGGERGVVAPFFGRPARCDGSASVLARRHRAHLVFAACYRTGPWRWRAEVPCVIGPDEAAALAPEALAARVNAELERLILAAPEQYFWLHERWRGAPVAAGSSAAAQAPPGASSPPADADKRSQRS